MHSSAFWSVADELLSRRCRSRRFAIFFAMLLLLFVCLHDLVRVLLPFYFRSKLFASAALLLHHLSVLLIVIFHANCFAFLSSAHPLQFSAYARPLRRLERARVCKSCYLMRVVHAGEAIFVRISFWRHALIPHVDRARNICAHKLKINYRVSVCVRNKPRDSTSSA